MEEKGADIRLDEVNKQRMLDAMASPFCMVAVVDVSTDTMKILEKKCDVEGELDKVYCHSNYWDMIVKRHALEKYQQEMLHILNLSYIKKYISQEKCAISYCFQKRLKRYGSETWSRLEIRWMSNDVNGQTRECIISLKNIEEEIRRKEIERRAIEESYHAARQADDCREEFMSSITYKLYEPVDRITGLLEMTRHYIGDRKYAEKYIAQAEETVKELRSTLNEIIYLNKIRYGEIHLQKNEIDLVELLKYMRIKLNHIINEKAHLFSLSFHDMGHSCVYGDKARLKEILINLAYNAVCYTPPDGEILFSVIEEDWDQEEEISRYRIIVQDNGVGMQREAMDKIYEPFVSDMEEAQSAFQYGLGLFVVQNLVSLMNGEIYIDSKPDKGTRVEVVLPLQVIEELTYEKIMPCIKNMPDNMRIFDKMADLDFKGKMAVVAIDNRRESRTVAKLLQKTGLEVRRVQNGLEVVHLAETEQNIAFIFVDIQIPILNGYETAKKVRDSANVIEKKIPIIAVSSNKHLQNNTYADSCGINAYLQLPIELENLYQILQRWV